uniref:Uncharacterized protein n=1 Tax=Anguilla anguilla TaxID=7936 RepID=A0A0E9WRI0_ANGAN
MNMCLFVSTPPKKNFHPSLDAKLFFLFSFLLVPTDRDQTSQFCRSFCSGSMYEQAFDWLRLSVPLKKKKKKTAFLDRDWSCRHTCCVR